MISTVGDIFIERLKARYSADSKVIVETTSDNYFSILSKRFPICGSKIAWNSVSGAIQKESNVQDINYFFKDASNFLEEMLARRELSEIDEVIIIGDSAIEEAIRLPIKFLKEIFSELLELPQHLYILQENGDWCLSVTMEGDLCFGNGKL